MGCCSMSDGTERAALLEVGDDFPSFVLQDENGEPFDSSELSGRRYVIYFYPKDNTAGCAREAREFSEALPEFERMSTSVFGVSKDSVKSHRNFVDKQGLTIKLLSDPDHVLLEQAGAWGPKISYGKMTVGTIRTTYVVGADGKVEKVWRNVRVPGHVEDVLRFVTG